MNKLLTTLLAAFGFGLWPMVAKKSIATPNWTIMIISGITFLGVLIFFLGTKSYKESIVWGDIKFLLIAGIINVIGWIFYSLIFGQGTSNGDFSSYVMVIGIAIPIFAAFGALIFLKEPISVQKSIGLIFGVISVYLLTK